MQRIRVTTAQESYEVLVGGKVADLPAYHNFKSGVVIAEKSIAANIDLGKLGLTVRSLDGGENIKNLAEIENLYRIFLDSELEKSSTVVAIGGGALTDAVAFAAATFHRGMPCITVPSTLLSQVDASIGGKNGVNFCGIKNIIGTIVQPKLVVCDLDFLRTLPRAEISCGVSEIIKAAVIADPELFSLLQNSAAKIFDLNEAVLEQVISKAVQVKADIVGRDEKESFERMKLNFGHTIGHALESAHKLPHGQAVGLGMILETKLATQLGLCSEDLVGKITDLCELYELPVSIDFDSDDIANRMLQDKKRRSDQLQFALPVKLGQVDIITVKVDDIQKHLSNLRSA